MGACRPSSRPHQPTAAESSLVAGRWTNYIPVSGNNSWAPDYLSRQLQRVSDVCTRQQLRSSSSTAFIISLTVQATIVGRAFSAAMTSVWNGLPEAVSLSVSLALFQKLLKTELFKPSYTGWLIANYTNTLLAVLLLCNTDVDCMSHKRQFYC